ncbi:putative ester cyclase [Isoptericola sp. CG 20/1183]|uniref:Ester cyclase n=1 Tax=Isoptericola halotolerans TaxID=300560 RepID=A0ABX5EJ86_9MICO|nr:MULTISPECIES: nuclear transport factor 2 family protein [Isoptericola]PRZ08705.1 putative ester cyclase [Isoptericola halotolerans]PRZ10848.1 putative ester cyclase [Isoptericola sp. CG 20/1183]
MTPRALVEQLADTIDGHRWEDLPALLHPDFSCRLVHTGETFDRDGWVRLNAEYPGFERFELLDVVADGSRAASRAHVTGTTAGERQHFEVAGFVSVRDGLVAELTEVWADVDQTAPEGTRPQ